LLREDLKKKGLSGEQIDDLFDGWNEQIQEKIDDNKPKEKEVRHGTSCIGIIDVKNNKTLTEW